MKRIFILVITFVISTTLPLFVLIHLTENPEHTFRFENHKYPVLIESNKHLQTSDEKRLPVSHYTKTILVFGRVWGYRFNPGRTGYVNSGCPVSNCILTTNRSLVKDDNFDAIIIHLPTFNSSLDKRLLPHRRPHQMFIMYSYEPPTLNGLPEDLYEFDGYFNRTMTYLSGSAFNFAYGRIEPLPSAPKTELQRLRMMQKARENSASIVKGKTGLVAWMVTNWWSPSNRGQYVTYLRKYLQVDVFGESGLFGGKKFCPRYTDGCHDSIEENYKFYLSFENSICKEYVTEKFFGIMARNMVPIVLGGADYAAIAPPHSYINALDFTPKELAEYLTKLDKDDALYAEYFWWKPHYKVVSQLTINKKSFCDICEALHAEPQEQKTVVNLHDWYYTNSQCIWWPVYESN